jgi:hypothetical protein
MMAACTLPVMLRAKSNVAGLAMRLHRGDQSVRSVIVSMDVGSTAAIAERRSIAIWMTAAQRQPPLKTGLYQNQRTVIDLDSGMPLAAHGRWSEDTKLAAMVAVNC